MQPKLKSFALASGGQQFMRIEHVHVNDGGQAVIGNVKKQDVQD